MKTIHIWFNNNYPEETKHVYYDVAKAINNGKDEIHTTCCNFASFSYKDYMIIIHPYVGEEFEVNVGYNKQADRELRVCHNIFKMLLAGVFSNNGVNVTGE